MVRINEMKIIRAFPRLKKPDNVVCKQFQLGKMTKSIFKRKTYSSDDTLELVHTDLCGPIRVKTYCGDKYFIILVDDYSIMMNVMFLKEKYNLFQMFEWYLTIVEKETLKILKCLRSYKGGEFIYEEFNIFCNDRGIKR